MKAFKNILLISLLIVGFYYLQKNKKTNYIQKHPDHLFTNFKTVQNQKSIEHKAEIVEEQEIEYSEPYSWPEEDPADDWTDHEDEVNASLFLEDYIDYQKNFYDEVEDEDLVYCDALVINCLPKESYTPVLELDAEIHSIENNISFEESLSIEQSYGISCLTRAKNCVSLIVYSSKIPEDAPELPFYYEGLNVNQENLMEYKTRMLEDLLNHIDLFSKD